MFLRYIINDQNILLRINDKLDLVRVEIADSIISKRLYEDKDLIGWVLHKTKYYNEEHDSFLYFDFSKDFFICLFILRLLIIIVKEINDWYLSFRMHIAEIKQYKNKLKRE